MCVCMHVCVSLCEYGVYNVNRLFSTIIVLLLLLFLFASMIIISLPSALRRAVSIVHFGAIDKYIYKSIDHIIIVLLLLLSS